MRPSPSLVTVTLILCAAATVASAAPLVVVRGGDGYTVPLPLTGVTADGMDQWLGIRYAQAPLGAQRWRPPGPPPAVGGEATAFGSPCLQGEASEHWGSEDCLFLNVFRPAGTPAAPLPVIFHIHGGGNTWGEAVRRPGAIVRKGVIVVTLNYRLGIFGFLAHPALAVENGGASGNWGIHDQLAALRWVHENIAAFGGDPDNVTGMGFSAGSNDALALMASPKARGLLQRVAVLSASHFAITGTRSSRAYVENVGGFMAEWLGCGDHTEATPEVLACLRGKDALQVLDQATFMDWDNSSPAVDGDVLPASILELTRAAGGTMPVLIETGREENSWDLFWMGDLYGPMNHGDYVQHTTDFLGLEGGKIARGLFDLARYGTYEQAAVQLNTTIIRTCPARLLLRANTGQPTYRALFAHAVDEDPFLHSFGSAHGIDDLFFWGFDDDDPEGWYTPSPRERVLADQVQRYFVNFAIAGDPSPASGGLAVGAAWPVFEPQHERIMLLEPGSHVFEGGWMNDECDALERFPLWESCGSTCRHFNFGVFHLKGWWFDRVGF